MHCEQSKTISYHNCDSVKYKYYSEETQSCVSKNDHCFKCPSVAFTEHRVKGFCNQFIRCIDGNPEILNCGPDLLYDDDLDTCNFDKLVTCDPCPISDTTSNIYVPHYNNLQL